MASWRYVCFAAAYSALPFGGGCTSSQAFFSASGDLESVVAAELDAAGATVDVAIYTFTAENVQNALIDAASRGVEVRLVMDAEQEGTLSEQRGVLTSLREAGVDVRTADGFGGGIMHHKFMVIDARTVLTGSYNYTRSANEANDENLVVLADPNLARVYDDAFQELWARAQE